MSINAAMSIPHQSDYSIVVLPKSTTFPHYVMSSTNLSEGTDVQIAMSSTILRQETSMRE